MFPAQKYGRFLVGSSGRLTITGVKKEDEGVYVCSALSTAGLGPSSANAMLKVVGKWNEMEKGMDWNGFLAGLVGFFPRNCIGRKSINECIKCHARPARSPLETIHLI